VLSREASPSGDAVGVETPQGSHEAGQLVVAPGAWAPELLLDIGLPLRVVRQVMFWFEPKGDPELFSPECFPVFMWEPDDGKILYGIPDSPGSVKAALHHVDEIPCTPETLDREVREEEVERVRDRLEVYVPALAGRCLDARACMYTNTPDLHFVIAPHPRYPQVAVACGFSGHGYKFCSVVGEILADLTTDGSTRHPIGLFSPERLEDLTTRP
jgi:sarcosine oxidase